MDMVSYPLLIMSLGLLSEYLCVESRYRMSDSNEYESAISFWNTVENLGTITEDVVAEQKS